MAAFLADLYAKYLPDLKVLACSKEVWTGASLSLHRGISKKDARCVRFANPIVSLAAEKNEDHSLSDCWISNNEINSSRQSDVHSIERCIHIQRYLRYTDAAYIDIIQRRKRTASRDLNLAILRGAALGFRALERDSCESRRRIKSSRRVVESVVARFRSLQSQGVKSWETQLCKYSQLLSQDNQRWARYMGEIDASVAVVDYDSASSCHHQ
jgi:hypothetical protein